MTQPVSSVTAVLPKDTVYTVNDSDVKVVDGRPSLLVDEIVSTDNSASGSDYRGVLVDKAVKLVGEGFHEQLMIFAQRPDATACAEYDLWNDTMRRYMRRGSKGIALVDNSREKPRLRYVFDISDTGLRKNSRHPFLWELRPEHEAAVAQALAERFGTPPENNLAEQLESIAAQLVSEYWVEHKRDIHIRPTFSLTGQPPRMCRSCWDILM